MTKSPVELFQFRQSTSILLEEVLGVALNLAELVSQIWEGPQSVEEVYIIGSEDQLLAEIETLRGRLHDQVGDKYSYDKVKAARALSSHLDMLLNKWYELKAKKQVSR